MLRTFTVIVSVVVVLWVVVWALVGGSVARARGWSTIAGASLCVVLGPIGLVALWFMSRHPRIPDSLALDEPRTLESHDPWI